VGHPQIAAFARLANGGTNAARAIAGQNTLFSRTIHGMDYDHVRDEIVVPGWYNLSILIFDGGATGNIAPKRQIMGSRTTLVNPQRVKVDPINGEILVPQVGRVVIFDRDANGDVAPKRVLAGPDTGLRGEGSVAVDYVHNFLVVSGGNEIRIFDRTASGNTRPLRVIQGASGGRLTVNSENGLIFGTVGGEGGEGELSGRYAPLDYVGVWSVFDDGPTPARWTIGGPNLILKDVRGIALDHKNQNVIVSDKTANAVFTFHIPEVFQ
jgi:hypothetical protein